MISCQGEDYYQEKEFVLAKNVLKEQKSVQMDIHGVVEDADNLTPLEKEYSFTVQSGPGTAQHRKRRYLFIYLLLWHTA